LQHRNPDALRPSLSLTMNKLVLAIVFVVVTTALYFVCANAHVDFFPCEITKRDRAPTVPGGQGQLRTTDGTCSLMAHNWPESDGEKERLTPLGWAVLAAFCGGIGLVSGLAVGVATRKRR
jgi:hypothetical protein